MALPYITLSPHKECRGRRSLEKQSIHSQRRDFFRAIYPKSSRPKILNMDVEVVDISRVSLRFCCKNYWDALSKKIENNETVEISVLLHDNTVSIIQGRITKCYTDIYSRQQYYVLMLTEHISSKKISNEQSYLLKHFPDFAKFIYSKSNQTQ